MTSMTPTSPAFDRFLAQYHATGREKADGYAAEHFAGMTPAEKARAFDLLADEARLDPASCEWLFRLDPARALPICRALLAAEVNNPDYPAFILHGLLLRHTGDPSHQQAMIDQYPLLSPTQKARALEHLGRTPPTPGLRDFLAGLVLTESDESRQTAAAYHLLVAHQMPYQSVADKTLFRGLLAELTDPTPAVRRAALARISVRP